MFHAEVVKTTCLSLDLCSGREKKESKGCPQTLFSLKYMLLYLLPVAMLGLRIESGGLCLQGEK